MYEGRTGDLVRTYEGRTGDVRGLVRGFRGFRTDFVRISYGFRTKKFFLRKKMRNFKEMWNPLKNFDISKKKIPMS